MIKLPYANAPHRTRKHTAMIMRSGDHRDYQLMLSLEHRKANTQKLREDKLRRQREGAVRARRHRSRQEQACG